MAEGQQKKCFCNSLPHYSIKTHVTTRKLESDAQGSYVWKIRGARLLLYIAIKQHMTLKTDARPRLWLGLGIQGWQNATHPAPCAIHGCFLIRPALAHSNRHNVFSSN